MIRGSTLCCTGSSWTTGNGKFQPVGLSQEQIGNDGQRLATVNLLNEAGAGDAFGGSVGQMSRLPEQALELDPEGRKPGCPKWVARLAPR